MMTNSIDNNVKAGFLNFPAFIDDMLNQLSDSAISQAIPDERLKNIRHVVVTGNGDSYAASLATKEFNSKIFRNMDYQALRCIDVSRHHVFCEEHPEQTLVMVISVSGGGARVTEAMQRARKKGCTTVAITGTPQSRMAQAAEFTLQIQIPKSGEMTPANQAKSYVAAVCTTTLFGLHVGKILGTVTDEQDKKMRQEISRYVHTICAEQTLTSIDDQMYVLAEKWKDYKGFDFVGGGVDFATAYFGTAKFFELCGSLNCLNDAEDWCHIDYFQTDRNLIGTVGVASANCASFTRMVETIASMQKSGRNVLVVSDQPADVFAEGVTVCTLPAAKYDNVNPMMNFIPLFMLGNYIAIDRKYPYFGGPSSVNPLLSQDGNINTIKSSNIEYID